jgi:hypothetical protein
MPSGDTTMKRIIVFVHGYSVTHTRTYGGLPQRLAAEARGAGLDITVREIFLGKYISFRDEVRLEDIARAFEAAVRRELIDLVRTHGRFACITHSTGGPVIREWWQRYYATAPAPASGSGDAGPGRAISGGSGGGTHSGGGCPMSHLIMLAPANFSSALAQLGKGRLSRIKTWFQGIEPGTGVLDWLELGSREAWDLNTKWIAAGEDVIGPAGIFPFALIGQTIDRKLYDNLNTYTGELGSDGVVRVAAANLNATYIRLEQEKPRAVRGRKDACEAPKLTMEQEVAAPRTAMLIVAGKSHGGTSKGIVRSVRPSVGRAADRVTVNAILDCLKVATMADYTRLCDRFDAQTVDVLRQERLEIEDRLLLPDTYFIHDLHAMVIFRLRDEAGHAIEDFDLVLTAGPEGDPNRFPRGFVADRQRNRIHRGTLTYYFNYDLTAGCEAVMRDGKVLRAASAGTKGVGLKITARPEQGFVHYLPCELRASKQAMDAILKPNQTAMVEIVLRRVVREGVFRLDRGTKQRSFKKDKPGAPLG